MGKVIIVAILQQYAAHLLFRLFLHGAGKCNRAATFHQVLPNVLIPKHNFVVATGLKTRGFLSIIRPQSLVIWGIFAALEARIAAYLEAAVVPWPPRKTARFLIVGLVQHKESGPRS